MTRDELLYLQQRLRDAGASAELVVLLGEAERDMRIRKTCERAVARALFPSSPQATPSVFFAPQPVAKVQHPPEPGGTVVPVSLVNRDSVVPVSMPMGVKHIARKALLIAPGFAPQDKAIIAALVERADTGTGGCHPSRRTLALDAGIGGEQPERAVLRAIHKAEADGLVTRVRGLGGRGLSTRYILRWAVFHALLGQCEGRAVVTMKAAAARVRNRDNRRAETGTTGTVAVPQTLIEESTSLDSGVRHAPREPWDPKRSAEGRSGGREPFQITMPLPIPGGRDPAAGSGDRIVAAIRGKYGRDHRKLTTYLSAWWSLGPEERAGFRDLVAFEAWLRSHGQPVGGEGFGRAGEQTAGGRHAATASPSRTTGIG